MSWVFRPWQCPACRSIFRLTPSRAWSDRMGLVSGGGFICMTEKTATNKDNERNLVEVRDVHFRLGSRVIYDGVNIDIVRGRITVIMGPSGTGKTTLLRLISGQWRPDAGTVTFDGHDV